MMRRSGWIWAAVFVAMAGLAVWGLSGSKNAAVPGPPPGGPMRGMPVEVARVQVGTLQEQVGTVGSLQANESVIIRSEIAGRITGIHFAEGRGVRRGARLFSIDSSEFAAQVAQISAAADLNRSNLERAKPLKDADLLSAQEYEQLEAKLKESEAAQTVAQERLRKTEILAPFSGRVGLRQISPGDYVQPGQALVNLEDLTTMKVDFRVPGVHSPRVVPGQRIELAVDAFPGRRFAGAVSAVDPRLDETTRTILVRAGVPTPGGELRPGMFARVAVTLGERPDALLIPEQAVVPMGADKFVFRLIDGKAALTKVALGQRREGGVEVVSGLSAEDTVVTAGQMKIRDGMPVVVMGPAGPVEAGPPAPPKG